MGGVHAVPVRSDSLRSRLVYEPRDLRFGTSGRRGLVADLTQLEIYIDVTAELEYLQSLPREAGGIARGEELYLAYDLRPSSTAYVADHGGRGEIAQAVVRAARDAGMRPVNHRISSTLWMDMSGRMPPLRNPSGAGPESSSAV